MGISKPEEYHARRRSAPDLDATPSSTRYAALMLLLLLACAEPPTACSEEAVASVTVRVLDADGVPVTADLVHYYLNYDTEAGNQPVDAECTSADCSEWVAGWDQQGTFDVSVVAYDGPQNEGPGSCSWSGHGQATVSEAADGCHVEGQSIDVVLTDYECTD